MSQPLKNSIKIGVLALQGDFDAHRQMLERLGAEWYLLAGNGDFVIKGSSSRKIGFGCCLASGRYLIIEFFDILARNTWEGTAKYTCFAGIETVSRSG